VLFILCSVEFQWIIKYANIARRYF